MTCQKAPAIVRHEDFKPRRVGMDRTLPSLSSQQQRHHSRQRSVSLTSGHNDAATSALALSSPHSPVSRSHSPMSNRRLSTVSRRPTTYQNLPRGLYLTRKPVGSVNSLTARQAFANANANAKAQRRPRFLRNWWMEIGACLLFMIAFVAIIATLYPHQGRPLPEWPFQISINALVSVYVVVLKTTIVFVTAEGLGTYAETCFNADVAEESDDKHLWSCSTLHVNILISSLNQVN